MTPRTIQSDINKRRTERFGGYFNEREKGGSYRIICSSITPFRCRGVWAKVGCCTGCRSYGDNDSKSRTLKKAIC